MVFSHSITGRYLCTLQEPVYYPGASAGRASDPPMTLLPAEPDSGIRFRRTDVEADKAVIKASWRNAYPSEFGTMLVNQHGTPVNAVERVMAALRGSGVDNVIVEIDGCDLPTFDGSSAPLLAMINRAGLSPQILSRPGIWIERPIEAGYGESYAILNPASVPRVTVNLELPDMIFDPQCISLEMIDHVFAREIAPARDLGINLDLSGAPRNVALPDHHGALVNILHGRIKPQNWSLRYRDEPARYKLLECYGVLALSGASIFGHLFVHQPNQQLYHTLLREIFQNRQNWSRLSYDSIERRVSNEYGELALQSKMSSMRAH